MKDKNKQAGRVTIKDLARDLGLSVSTISRAFQPNSTIADDSRERVLQHAAKRGYKANPFARSLIGKKNRMVGAFVSRIGSPVYSEVVSKLSERLSQNDMALILVAGDHYNDIKDCLNMLLAYEPVALVVMSSYAFVDSVSEAFIPHNKVVYFNRPPKRQGSLGVLYDNLAAGQRIAEYLIELGHRRLVYLSSGLDSYTDQQRQKGFVDYCRSQGIAKPRIIKSTDFTYDAGVASAKQIMPILDRTDAVFCATDMLGVGLLDGMRYDYGVDVPNLSIIGCDDIAITGWRSHSLTSLHLPREAIINETVRLIESIADDKRPSTELIRIAPGDIIPRESTSHK
jgi:DNA-binding LacI/PurR family transcriptional regulator